MEKYNPLHKKLPTLQTSSEVSDAVEKHTRLTGERVPNSPEARLDVYLDRLKHIFLNEDKDTRTRNIEMLRDKIHDAYLIKREDVPESYFELQKRVARERGQAVEDIPENVREEMVTTVIEDQRKSLDNWIDYLSSEDAVYPTWFKYFVFRNITRLSQFDKELGKFKERTKSTTAPFPDIYREALAQVADHYESATRNAERFKDPTFQTFLAQKFPTQYAEAIQKTLEHSVEDREQIKGAWVTYRQGDTEGARKLYQSLEHKGTGWCTAGQSTAHAQVKSGDFHVFYSLDKEGNPTQPRLAIRMNGTTAIGEVRGILPHQEVEPLLQETLDAKLADFGPEAERYKKKSSDMKHLTALVKATEAGKNLTRDDLRFLYELDSNIEGFGYQKDPRIEELRKKRDRKEDIRTLANCAPEHLVTDFTNLREDTEVYVEDTGTKLTLFDFRNEKNKDKLPKLLELAQAIKESGSPARPDLSFEGGIVSIAIPQEKLKDLSTALQAYKDADGGSPSWIWDGLNKIPYTQPTDSSLEVIVLNHGKTIPEQRDRLVSDMDKVGYRPLEFSELVALGIVKPELNKRNEVLNTYKKYQLEGRLLAPLLRWRGDARFLFADRVVLDWGGLSRFVFARK